MMGRFWRPLDTSRGFRLREGRRLVLDGCRLSSSLLREPEHEEEAWGDFQERNTECEVVFVFAASSRVSRV